MIPYWNEARFLSLLLAAEEVAATGAMLLEWWRRTGRRGRLHRLLQTLERKGHVANDGGPEMATRLFRLTPEGRQALAGPIIPEQEWARPWDGQWRLVLFDVPQAHVALRTRLRRKLRELRFGWLQNSVWLSPDPLNVLSRHFEKERGSVESLVFLEARPVGGESDAELVAGAWDFARLARLHASHLELLRLRPARERRSQAQAWVHWAQTEQRAWTQILRVDPLLPEALWPKDYAGRPVWTARMEALSAAGAALARLGLKP